MSRIGKKSITIPSGTTVEVSSGTLSVKGKGGTLSRSVHPAVSIAVEDGAVAVTPSMDSRLANALWGTYAAHVRNMIQGVNEPFVKKLQIEGIGYRAEAAGKTLSLSIGFSHPVKVQIPDGITISVEKNIITISGSDKEQVGEFAAIIRAKKKPEPYKGKGIRYVGEVIREKKGKKVTSTTA
ncbi:MAG: 50S ribosomal protein L6 [Parcubacteria group bacterium GW2011_GWA2_51_10]|nr:MAG: 50S ribosomal protein L6 [Parcubacteria group bacterium GW2011_GWA2_51_10]